MPFKNEAKTSLVRSFVLVGVSEYFKIWSNKKYFNVTIKIMMMTLNLVGRSAKRTFLRGYCNIEELQTSGPTF